MDWRDVLIGILLVVVLVTMSLRWFLKKRVYLYLGLMQDSIREFRSSENGRDALRDETVRRFDMRASEIMEKLIIMANVFHAEGIISDEAYEHAIDSITPEKIARKEPFPIWVLEELPAGLPRNAALLQDDFLKSMETYQICLRVAQTMRML